MIYTRGRLVNDGGEGYIYEVLEDPNLLLKLYKEHDSSGAPIVTPELQRKLEYMKNNPPEALIAKGIIAWPIELLKTEQGKLAGFIMPRLDIDEHLLRIYSYRHPELDSAEFAKFPSVKSRISIGINLCSALYELHSKGYVVGDLNHENIGVNYKTGQIYFMDCDSFHITNEHGEVFRTNVIMAGYLAPEIIEHCNMERSYGKPFDLDAVSLPTFTEYSDRFCLALHIFKLLMNGVDPFRGIKSEATGSTASPFIGNEAIERDAYVFRAGNKPSAVFCPSAESLPPEILALFNKAFIDGRIDPSARPDETVWYNALYQYLTNQLKQCLYSEKHFYYMQLPECPYCLADERHQRAQGGVIKKVYRDSPAVVHESSPLEIINKSRQRTRKLHTVISLILWVGVLLIYMGINLSLGRTQITLDIANWGGYEIMFIGAAFIECLLEIFFSRKELAVLRDNIDLREIDPKNYAIDLRGYQKKLTTKINTMTIISVLLVIICYLWIAYM